MKRVLDRFWFAEAPPARLAWLRILLGAYALWYVASHYSRYMRMGKTQSSLFEPVGVASLLDAPLPLEVWQALLVAALLFNVVFIFGWLHRVSGPVFAALLLAVLSYRNSWSMIYHSHTLLVLHVIVLGLAPSADTLSLDAWLRRRRQGSPASGPSASWRYGWALRLMCAVTLASYWLSGMAKVLGPLGWSWAEGESMRSQIAIDGLRKELLGTSAAPLAFVLYEQVALFGFLGVTTLVLEIGAPLALLGRRLALVWVVAVFGMHWGILFLMDIRFTYHLYGVAFAPFLPLDRAADWIRRQAASIRPGRDRGS